MFNKNVNHFVAKMLIISIVSTGVNFYKVGAGCCFSKPSVDNQPLLKSTSPQAEQAEYRQAKSIARGILQNINLARTKIAEKNYSEAKSKLIVAATALQNSEALLSVYPNVFAQQDIDHGHDYTNAQSVCDELASLNHIIETQERAERKKAETKRQAQLEEEARIRAEQERKAKLEEETRIKAEREKQAKISQVEQTIKQINSNIAQLEAVVRETEQEITNAQLGSTLEGSKNRIFETLKANITLQLSTLQIQIENLPEEDQKHYSDQMQRLSDRFNSTTSAYAKLTADEITDGLADDIDSALDNLDF